MSATAPRAPSRAGALAVVGGAAAVITAGLGAAVVSLMISMQPPASPCTSARTAGAGPIMISAAGGGTRVGASEYGGPGDPGSGTVGASGVSLVANPDSYAELGGTTFQTAAAMGGLPYITPLRVSWDGRSAVAYKRDFGLGGGPIDGLPRVIDLWWRFAQALGIPYEDGRWSGPVTVSAVATAGAANLLGGDASELSACAASASTAGTAAAGPLQLAPGDRAELLPNGQAAAPADAPSAVKGMIAAGNQIVGKPYVYGAGHGLPLNQVAPAYDCSSSVEHLLYGGGLLPDGYGAASGALESFGLPGPGRWVTIYASADHVFMYVAGLRWDTHNAAGPGDGSTGIGWHPLVRSSAGFVARHPAGL
jgi:cell wall-associated NlpC family hydrolase